LFLLLNVPTELKESKSRYGASYQSPYAMAPKKIGNYRSKNSLADYSIMKFSNFSSMFISESSHLCLSLHRSGSLSRDAIC